MLQGGQGNGVQKHWVKKPGQKITPFKDTSGGELGQFLGTITKVGPKFGFIECTDLQNLGELSNVFVLADEMKQYKAGQKVKFTAYKDTQGRLQGKDLKSGLKNAQNNFSTNGSAGKKWRKQKD